MRPVVVKNATATVSANAFTAEISEAHSGAVKLSQAKLHIGPFAGTTVLSLRTELDSTFPAAMGILSQPLINLPELVPQVPWQTLQGNVAGHFGLELPLTADIKLRNAKIEWHAEVDRLASTQPVFGHMLTKQQAIVDGTIKRGITKVVTQVVDIPVQHGAPFWTGKFDINVDYQSDAALALEVALDHSALAVTPVQLTKPAAEPFALKLRQDKSSPKNVWRISSTGKDLACQGELRIDEAENISAELSKLTFKQGEHVTTVGLAVSHTEKTVVSVRSQDKLRLSIAATRELANAGDGKPGNRNIELIVEELASLHLIDTNQELTDVQGKIRLGGHTLVELEATGPDEADVAVKLEKEANAETMQLVVTSDDAAATAKLLNSPLPIEGGSLQFRGEVDAAADITGELQIENVVVRDSPLIARILTLSDLRKAFAVIRGKAGILVNQLKVNLSVRKDALALSSGRLRSASLAATLESAEIAGEKIKANGVLMPIRGASRLLSSMPLGKWLTDDEGRGLMGMDYSIKGPVKDPNVWVNPLTAIAPNFVRKMFGF
jgi:hypothetical protein